MPAERLVVVPLDLLTWAADVDTRGSCSVLDLKRLHNILKGMKSGPRGSEDMS